MIWFIIFGLSLAPVAIFLVFLIGYALWIFMGIIVGCYVASGKWLWHIVKYKESSDWGDYHISFVEKWPGSPY